MCAVKSKTAGQSVVYSGLCGIDLSGDGSGISKKRLSYAENMYIDYEGDGGGAIESIPGFRKLCSLGMKINCIHTVLIEGVLHLFVLAGNALYRATLDELNSGHGLYFVFELSGQRTRAVSLGADTFITDGVSLLHIDKAGRLREVNGDYEHLYIPTTYLNGERFEQGNLLTFVFPIDAAILLEDFGRGTKLTFGEVVLRNSLVVAGCNLLDG